MSDGDAEAHRRLARLLASLRKHAGLTQSEFSARLQKPQPYISNVERGRKRIDMLEFCAMVRGLGQDPSEVLASFLKGHLDDT